MALHFAVGVAGWMMTAVVVAIVAAGASAFFAVLLAVAIEPLPAGISRQ
jgi:hypothetical protein